MTRAFSSVRTARSGLTLLSIAALSLVACGGTHEPADTAADVKEKGDAVGQDVGATLGKASAGVKKKGDAVGKDVGEKFGDASQDVKETLGDEPHAPPPKTEAPATER